MHLALKLHWVAMHITVNRRDVHTVILQLTKIPLLDFVILSIQQQLTSPLGMFQILISHLVYGYFFIILYIAKLMEIQFIKNPVKFIYMVALC